MSAPIAALVYRQGDPVDGLLVALARRLKARGLRLAGLVQHPHPADDCLADPMLVEDLTSGAVRPITQDLGCGATGCRVDADALAALAAGVERALHDACDLLIVNRFGRLEEEGGGMRREIALALERGVPVVVAVPAKRLHAWRDFAGDYAVELAADAATAEAWLDRCRAVPA